MTLNFDKKIIGIFFFLSSFINYDLLVNYIYILIFIMLTFVLIYLIFLHDELLNIYNVLTYSLIDNYII